MLPVPCQSACCVGRNALPCESDWTITNPGGEREPTVLIWAFFVQQVKLPRQPRRSLPGERRNRHAAADGISHGQRVAQRKSQSALLHFWNICSHIPICESTLISILPSLSLHICPYSLLDAVVLVHLVSRRRQPHRSNEADTAKLDRPDPAASSSTTSSAFPRHLTLITHTTTTTFTVCIPVARCQQPSNTFLFHHGRLARSSI